MKKTVVFALFLILAFSFCKKNSTESDKSTEDKITIEVCVKENGEAVPALFVEVDATVGECIGDEESPEWNTERLPTQDTQEEITNKYGLATFVYENKSLADKTIVITEIRILQTGNLIHKDSEDKVIPTNTKKRFEYDISN